MHRLHEFFVTYRGTGRDISLFTQLEEKADGGYFINVRNRDSIYQIDITGKEDEFIDRIEKTNICRINNKMFIPLIDYEDGMWMFRIRYDEKDIFFIVNIFLNAEAIGLLKLINIEEKNNKPKCVKIRCESISPEDKIQWICGMNALDRYFRNYYEKTPFLSYYAYESDDRARYKIGLQC